MRLSVLSDHQNNYSSSLHPYYFYANSDELRDPYFEKVESYVPPVVSLAPPGLYNTRYIVYSILQSDAIADVSVLGE